MGKAAAKIQFWGKMAWRGLLSHGDRGVAPEADRPFRQLGRGDGTVFGMCFPGTVARLAADLQKIFRQGKNVRFETADNAGHVAGETILIELLSLVGERIISACMACFAP